MTTQVFRLCKVSVALPAHVALLRFERRHAIRMLHAVQRSYLVQERQILLCNVV